MGLVNINLFPEEACSNSGNAPGLTKLGLNIPNFTLLYDPAANEMGFWKMRAINYGTNSTLGLDFTWHATGTITGTNVVWAAAVAAITPGDAQNFGTKTFGTFSSVTGTASATVSGVVQNTLTITSLDSLASGDLFWLQFGRSGSNASDSMVADAALMDLNLYYNN